MAFATGYFQSIHIVGNHMKERWELIAAVLPKPDTGFRDSCLKGLYLRASAWMQSLEKLDQAKGAQAAVAGSRALLEIAVDTVLLHHDKTNGSGWRMYNWAESEKMKAAEQTIAFYQEKGLAVPEIYEARVKFLDEKKDLVDGIRRNLWPNKKDPQKAVHPARWTGSSDLSVDIRTADQLHEAFIKNELGVSLEELYRTEYRQMNWFIHSGVASVFGLPADHYNLMCGLAFRRCAEFGMICAKTILTDFGFSEHFPDLRQEWKDIELNRALSFLEAQGAISANEHQ